ncbi:hypothetical protein HOD30_00810 [Candidatus Peregrinibacteria bacterium]|jgi:hypothetical protein|nr:hypothetical protein [Candidatus Peregrinibacteria bacterium]MBT4631919.1 hypothetical protein [Candidatus Peregrinibacteria bacterium]MBT5516484.1 hypothetical protein [Candidatus Peregrinibacteria bacterium]MBT5824160.1 hypothetical protein [Candidatus Peregrinibacteria bacterium]
MPDLPTPPLGAVQYEEMNGGDGWSDGVISEDKTVTNCKRSWYPDTRASAINDKHYDVKTQLCGENTTGQIWIMHIDNSELIVVDRETSDPDDICVDVTYPAGLTYSCEKSDFNSDDTLIIDAPVGMFGDDMFR